MATPLRKEHPEFDDEQEITTADLAQGKRPAVSEDRPKPVLAGRTGESVQDTSREARSEVGKMSDATPLFPNNELEELRNRWSGVQAAFVDEPRRASGSNHH